jgi:hypothetical protein
MKLERASRTDVDVIACTATHQEIDAMRVACRMHAESIRLNCQYVGRHREHSTPWVKKEEQRALIRDELADRLAEANAAGDGKLVLSISDAVYITVAIGDSSRRPRAFGKVQVAMRADIHLALRNMARQLDKGIDAHCSRVYAPTDTGLRESAWANRPACGYARK